MSRARAFATRLAALFKTSRADAELRRELEAHVALHTDDNIRKGMLPLDARREASKHFGSMAATEDACRDSSRLSSAVTLGRELRHAALSLRRSPTFTVTVVLSLALGLGAVAAVFAVSDAILY